MIITKKDMKRLALMDRICHPSPQLADIITDDLSIPTEKKTVII